MLFIVINYDELKIRLVCRLGMDNHPTKHWLHECDFYIQLLENFSVDLRCSFVHRGGASSAAPRIPEIPLVSRSIWRGTRHFSQYLCYKYWKTARFLWSKYDFLLKFLQSAHSSYAFKCVSIVFIFNNLSSLIAHICTSFLGNLISMNFFILLLTTDFALITKVWDAILIFKHHSWFSIKCILFYWKKNFCFLKLFV